MAPTDLHQGGRLEDMAAEGTTIPGDAGKQRLISSNIEKKNLDDADKVPEAKGHDQYVKHVRKQQSEFDENSGRV
ncbi:structural constituent of cytoskeleton [Ascochyta rabiei]|uniref:Structural constituent of cytoskeleton n=1 Tax=Didymella rabiei TaxID=5454 RepID=A0A163INM4_DIDRA|nr:structural constituent of cytoskeleton [Ascochyta rabiei]